MSVYTVRVEHGRRRPDSVTPEHGPVTPAYLEHPSAVTHVKVSVEPKHDDGRDKSDHEMDQEALHTAYQMAHETGGARGHDMVTKTDIIHLEAAHKVAHYDLPPEQGSAPVPEGHVRLYHQTDSETADAIRHEGLSATHGGRDGNPHGLWASSGEPFYRHGHDLHTVEFHVPVEHLTDDAEDTRHVRNGSVDPKKWEQEKHTVLLNQHVHPSQIIGIHEPWHGHVRYMHENGLTDEVKAGQHDDLAEMDPKGYGQAINHIKAHGSKTAHYNDPNWRPSARIFGPGQQGEDPRLFDGDHLKSQVREDLLGTLGEYWEPKFGKDWPTWSKVYFTGSEASHWFGNDDFDVLIGVDYDKFKAATGSRLHPEEIDDLLNQGFRADMNGKYDFEGTAFDRTWYVNAHSYDIRRLKPYAAYNVTDDIWSVRPVTVPKDWGPDKFPDSTWHMAEHYANEIDRISQLTPASVQQHYAQMLFAHIHTDRQRAFSERGTGVFDVGNVAEKYLDQRPDHPLAMLVEMKNQSTGVGKTAHMTDEEFDQAWAPEQGSMEGYRPPGKRQQTDEAFRLKRHIETLKEDEDWGGYPGEERHARENGYKRTNYVDFGRTAKKKGYEAPTVSGIALRAADTGRLLMIQRSNNDKKDPAAGTWEFPGGHHEDGDHTSLHAGIREWEEEVGQKFPKDGTVVHTWRTGPYQGHMVVIPKEEAVDFSKGRCADNPDDPDCDDHEQAVWWEPEHARKNPALRQECKDNWKEIVPGLKHTEANAAHADETGHLVNPADGSHDWHHGTPHSFKEFGHDEDEDDYGNSDSDSEENRHWNTYLGTHWTSLADTADKFAKGLHQNKYVGGKGHAGEVHTANLGITNPKHYSEEEEMDSEAFDHHWEHGRHDREDPYDYHWDACQKEDCGGLHEHGDDDVAEHVRGEYKGGNEAAYLQRHPHKQEIAEDYRDRLKAQGHDGVTYGNGHAEEGPVGHTCAINFDEEQVHNHRIRPGKFGYKTASAEDEYTYKHVVHQPRFGEARYGQNVPHPQPEDVYNEGHSKAMGGSHIFEHQLHHKGVPVAKLRYSMHPDEPHVLNIEGIAVHPHHRSKGLMFRLIDHMQEHARKIGGLIDHGTYTDQGHAFSRKYMATDHYDPSLHLPYPEHPTATKGHEFLPHMMDPDEITHGYTASLGNDRWHEGYRSTFLGDGWYHDEDEAQHNLENTGTYHPSNGRVLPSHHHGIQRTGVLDGVPISDQEQEDRLAPGTFKEQSKPQAEPSDHVVQGARAYCGPRGMGDPHDIDYSTVKTTADNTRKIGRAFHSLPDHDPDAVPHFEAMRKEIHAQYEHMTGHMGIKVHMVDEDPYSSSKEMMHDVHHNKTIKVLRTAKTGGHPYFSDDENDKFRAVHDVFGHAATGRGFDKHGEEAAYTAHSKMFSPMARPAMETETRGQNHFYNLNGRFAKQKVAIVGKALGTYHPPQQHGVTARLLMVEEILV